MAKHSLTKCVGWFEQQCEYKRRILQLLVLVPNSDPCVYFVQEWNVELQEWQNIGDGFSVAEAIGNAIDAEGTPTP